MLLRHTIEPVKTAHYPRVAPQMPVRTVASHMAAHRVGAALVFEDGAIAGIFTERDLISRVLGKEKPLATTPVGDVMTTALDIYDQEALILPVLKRMTEKHYRHALIRTDAAGTIRVTTQKDIIRYCWNKLSDRKKKGLRKKYLAADIAERYNDATHRNTIDISVSAQDALMRMTERRTGSLLIVHEEMLCGIFTERDVLTRIVAAGLPIESTRLINVATMVPNVITPEVNITIVMRLLLERNYRRIPISLLGKPLGMVTQRNVAYLMRDEFHQLFRSTPWNA